MCMMDITTQSISRWVNTNRFEVAVDERFIARCIDGRYPHAKDVAPLAYPGADVGQVLVVMAAAHTYGFVVSAGEVFDVLKKLEGGVGRIHDHTDELHTTSYCAGCGHVQLVRKYPKMYGLTKASCDEVLDVFAHMVHPDVLTGVHHESAVIVATGSQKWSIYSQDDSMSVFVVHKALTDARHRALAKIMVGSGILRVPTSQSKLDEETVYEYLSAVFDDHLIATSAHLATGLPQFVAKFTDGGEVVISDGGVVEPFTES